MTEVFNTTETEPIVSAADGPPDASASNSDWLDGLPEDLRRVAAHKGWREPADALKSYRHLEEYLGADKSGRGLVLPKNEDDHEGYQRLYQALGRPENPDGYALAEALSGHDDLDPAFMKTMSAAMHDAGLNKRQAHHLAQAWQGQLEQFTALEDKRYEEERDEVLRGISSGSLEAARRGFRFCKASPAQAEIIEKALGPKAAVEIFSRIGGALAEDRPVGEAKAQGFSGTADSARNRIDRLMADAAFSKRYLAGDKNAIDEITELARRATEK